MNFLVEMKKIPFALSPLRELDSGGVRHKWIRTSGKKEGWPDGASLAPTPIR